MRYRVKNGPTRTLEFDGTKLASSTSKTADSVRWVDFNLYITVAGTYILERIGQSDVFHAIGCEVAERNSLRFDPNDRLEDRHVPCEECDPNEDLDVLLLEKPRYFGLQSESPDAVLQALHRKNKEGVFYMTRVTERLIEDAAKIDKRLEKAFRVQYVA